MFDLAPSRRPVQQILDDAIAGRRISAAMGQPANSTISTSTTPTPTEVFHGQQHSTHLAAQIGDFQRR